ncbi:MAG: DUF4143 domain-containing protein [Acidimicrobiia bacterium]
MPEAEWAQQRRGVTDALRRALTRHTVVVLAGPPTVGKSTVARRAFDKVGAYLELGNDEAARTRAAASPAAFLRELPVGSVLDDAHLVPGLLAELEQYAERVRSPGALLAVSTTAGLRDAVRTGGLRRLPRVSIGPLTQSEQRDRIGRFIPAAFTSDPIQWPFETLSTAEYLELALGGGLPASSPGGQDAEDRRARYVDYLDRSLGQLGAATAQRLRATLDLIVHRPNARVALDADAAELGLQAGQLQEALESLQDLGLVRLSPAWSRFRRSGDGLRAYVNDPGLLSIPTGLTGRSTPVRPVPPALVLRSLVAHELHTQNAWSRPVDITYWRSKPSQYDIDFLLEAEDGAVVPVTVSPTLAPGSGEFAGIDAFRRRHPRSFRRGILLYPGDRIRGLTDNRWAVPFSALWCVAEQDAPLDVASLDSELEAAAAALRALVQRPTLQDTRLDEYRERIREEMQRTLAPRLERIALVLGSLGLQVSPVVPLAAPAGAGDPETPDWLPGLVQLLTARVERAQLSVISGLEISTAGPAEGMVGARWIAYVAAVVVGDGQLSWQAGHALLGGSTPALVGTAGPVSGPLDDVDDAMVDQLCAALAASLPDALAAQTPAA